jgi:hypothetical protein
MSSHEEDRGRLNESQTTLIFSNLHFFNHCLFVNIHGLPYFRADERCGSEPKLASRVSSRHWLISSLAKARLLPKTGKVSSGFPVPRDMTEPGRSQRLQSAHKHLSTRTDSSYTQSQEQDPDVFSLSRSTPATRSGKQGDRTRRDTQSRLLLRGERSAVVKLAPQNMKG